MTPCFDTLARLLDRFPVAMLTLVDGDARPRTRPMKTVRTGFNGHIWLRMDGDPTVANDIGRGAEVSLAYGSLEAGQYVTVYGWAIVLRNAASSRMPSGVLRTDSSGSQTRPLVCVSAHAAQMWDVAADASPRVFAFSHTQPSGLAESAEALPAFARASLRPRLAAVDAAL